LFSGLEFLFASKRIKANTDLIRSIIACFGILAYIIYSLIRFVRFKVFAEIRIQIFDLTQNKYRVKRKKIYVSERIFALTLFHTGEYSLQIIRFEAIIHKNQSKFHIHANIRLLGNGSK
jgi:hypothetical protein